MTRRIEKVQCAKRNGKEVKERGSEEWEGQRKNPEGRQLDWRKGERGKGRAKRSGKGRKQGGRKRRKLEVVADGREKG